MVHPKASIATLKPSSIQEPASSRERHAMQILQQYRNVALSFNIQAAQSHTKPIDISKLITGHFIALEKTWLVPVFCFSLSNCLNFFFFFCFFCEGHILKPDFSGFSPTISLMRFIKTFSKYNLIPQVLHKVPKAGFMAEKLCALLVVLIN